MNIISFPKLGSREYTVAKAKGKLLVDLGEVIIKQYGEKESVELLNKFNEAEKEKDKK